MRRLLVFLAIVLSCLIGFSQNNDTHKITVYPSPSVDGIIHLKIDCDFICAYKIYNINGDKVCEAKLSGRRQTVELNLSSLSSGVYVMVLYHKRENVSHRLKFVIAKPSLDKK